MSDVIRTLEGTGLSGRYRAYPRLARKRRKPRGCWRGLFFLFLAGGALVAYAAWTTRDAAPMECVIPSGQAYQVFASDVFNKRGKMANSRIWQVLPKSAGLTSIPQKLNRDLNVPEWILNNLIPGACHVSGNDLKAGSDLLFVTKTTRVGSLLLKGKRFIPGVKRDRAGGLNLYVHRGAGAYFATRGRLFIVSRSRAALIHALTLERGEALEAGTIKKILAESGGGEDLQGMIALQPEDPLGGYLKNVSFALRLDPREARLKCRGVLRPPTAERTRQVWSILAELHPRPLEAPPEGMLEISLNLNQSVRDLWTAFGYAAGKAETFEQWWAGWAAAPAEGASNIPAFAASLLAPLGPGIRLSWCGADFNAMIPVPEIVATLDASPETLREAFAALPPADGADPDEIAARYDSESQCASIPLIGGPSIEPTAAVFGEALLISSSRTGAEALLRKAPPAGDGKGFHSVAEELPEPGNLYIHVYPKPCIDTILTAAKMIAQYDLIKGYTAETLEAEAAPWVEAAGRVEDITLQAAYESGEVRAELKVVCTPPVENPR